MWEMVIHLRNHIVIQLFQKKECHGHIQKCMGTHLHNLHKETKGKLFTDEKNCKRKETLTSYKITMEWPLGKILIMFMQ